MKMFRNEEEYNKAVALLEELGDREGFEENEELVKQFELLSGLIEAYENQHTNIDVGNPIEIIKLKMEYMGLKQKDLQPYIGSSGIVSEVLNRKRGLSKSMIRKLSDFLHLDQNLLNTPYDLNEVSAKSAKPSKAKESRTVSDAQLFSEISSLPANLKQEVSDFVAFLKYKKGQSTAI
ncbi:hypothetical protein [Parapedobacter sp.]|uniref:hypothetical protein n=1 Tax=Parapedobacter sp. TaxID=1958893 RepID=UPI002D7F733B|nr:hypothetical protein [Parapedobacter sp.]